jgi:hypothetical protein
LRAEGFSCSWGVLYGGLGISKWQFFIKKIKIKFPAVNFFPILGHQTLDPDPGSGSGIRIRIKSMRIRNPDLIYIFTRIQSSKKATFHIIFDYLEDKAIQKDKTGNPVFLITGTLHSTKKQV